MFRKYLAGSALFAGLMAAPLAAHHSFAAEYDANQPLVIKGAVNHVDWVNPHSWLYLDVKGPDGQIQHWSVEGGSPNVLLRNGWTRDSLAEGTRIIVHGSASKDTALRANASDIQFPDGRKLDTGSSQGKENVK